MTTINITALNQTISTSLSAEYKNHCICIRNTDLCGADENQHECICVKILSNPSQNNGVNSNISCRFKGEHPCMCRVNPFACRASVEQHVCMCRVTPTNCRTLGSHHCICQSVGSEKCLANTGHACVCQSKDPGTCRSEEHQCTCAKTGPSCCQANTHIAITKCKSDIKTNVYINGPIVTDEVNIIIKDNKSPKPTMFNIMVEPVRMYRNIPLCNLHYTTTVAEVKNMITLYTNLRFCDIIMKFNGQALDNQCSIGSYGIQQGSCVNLTW